MPASPAMAEDLAAHVVGLYEKAELEMMARTARALSKGLDDPLWVQKKMAELRAYKAGMQQLLTDLKKEVQQGVETSITKAYHRGGMTAALEIQDIRKTTGFDPPGGMRAVEHLTQETLGNVLATHPRILRETEDFYRAAVSNSSAQVLLGTTTRRQATQQALNEFAKKGITGFVDKAGRNWNLGSYVEMAMRTGTGRAAVQGHVDRLQANGIDLVIVSDAPRECPLCRPWEGKILSLGGQDEEVQTKAKTKTGMENKTTQPTRKRSGGYPTLDEARAAGLMHCNCRHTVSAYFPGITRPMGETADPVGYQAGQKQRYYEREIRRSKRMEVVALDDAAKQKATRRKLAYQAKLQAHISAFQLKRLPYREVNLKAQAPKKRVPVDREFPMDEVKARWHHPDVRQAILDLANGLPIKDLPYPQDDLDLIYYASKHIDEWANERSMATPTWADQDYWSFQLQDADYHLKKGQTLDLGTIRATMTMKDLPVAKPGQRQVRFQIQPPAHKHDWPIGWKPVPDERVLPKGMKYKVMEVSEWDEYTFVRVKAIMPKADLGALRKSKEALDADSIHNLKVKLEAAVTPAQREKILMDYMEKEIERAGSPFEAHNRAAFEFFSDDTNWWTPNNMFDKFKNEYDGVLVNGKEVDDIWQDTLTNASDWLGYRISPDTWKDTGTLERIFPDPLSDRGSYHMSERMIHMPLRTWSKEHTLVHEMGHYLHDHNGPRLHEVIRAFFERRTKGHKLEPIYGDSSEMGYIKAFSKPYIGKVYGGWRGKEGTEILSMGLQLMFESPTRFYEADPEHFKLTLAIMLGALT